MVRVLSFVASSGQSFELKVELLLLWLHDTLTRLHTIYSAASTARCCCC